MKTLKLASVALAIGLAISACGGGGSDAGDSPFGNGSGNGTGSGGGDIPGTETPAVATSIGFMSVTPDNSPLIIQGATATGRSDTATLKFKLLDQVGQPVANQTVDFSVVPPGAVTLNIGSAQTDANGEVVTSVTSKATPTTIVVTAKLASNAGITATSNSLNVSGGDPIAAGFQIVAEKYNLDGNFIGDTTSISAYVRDSSGNPVPDGFAVNFTTDFGNVEGSCFTTNGVCDVEFRVQNPRTGGIANIVATGITTGGVTIEDEINIHMAGFGGGGYRLLDAFTEAPISSLNLLSCKQDIPLLVDDGTGRSPAAETDVGVAFATNGATASIKYGSPVADVLDPDFPPALIVVSLDLSNLDSNKCGDGAVNAANSTSVSIEIETPNGIRAVRNLDLTYPN